MKEKLIIFPFNGNGLEALDCVSEHFEVIGFIDDNEEKQGLLPTGIPVTGRSLIERYSEAKVLAVPGSPDTFLNRSSHILSLSIDPSRFARVIHPNATVSSSVRLGYNVLIMAGVVLTSNSIIGNHVCILPCSVVHHDSSIGDFSMLGGGVVVAGNVTVGENTYIGAGAKLRNNIAIGPQCLVGMGSNVLKSFEERTLIYGNPAQGHGKL